MVVASIAWTVTQEEIFSEWREYCADKSKNGETLSQRKFFYVFTCEYCFSHWVTISNFTFDRISTADSTIGAVIFFAFFAIPVARKSIDEHLSPSACRHQTRKRAG